MRALLYKDCYMILKYNGFFLLAALLFTAVAGIGTQTMFFAVYPPVVMAALGYSSLAYDERSGWLRYADALPYGRKRIVASKYLLSLLCCLATMLLLMISMSAFRLARGQFDLRQLGIVALVVLLACTAYISILLPISFFFGTEKGRLIYIFLTVLFCCGGYSIPMPQITLPMKWWLFPMVPIGAAVIWWGSYRLAVKLYQKRKL